MNTNNRTPSAPRQAVYRRRRQNGLQALPKPWDWINADTVKALALKAYHVATHGLVEDIQAGHLNDTELRQVFAANLADLMRDLVMAQAVSKGGCWPVGPETPPYQNYPQIAVDLCADLPASWRPQYPLYRPCPLPRGIGGVDPDEAKRDGIESSGQS
jgi:hypothetical protein